MTEDREYPERPVIAVGGVVISDARVLLIRRAQPPLEGRWSIPGGLLELGESIAQAIARELLEEAGVQVRALELIEIYEKVLRLPNQPPQYHFVILDYLCELKGGAAQAGSDVTDVSWVPEHDLERFDLTVAAKRVVNRAFAMSREHHRANHA
ncbi:MAG TPA: NUDIX hydrolase [Candidatus Acidoferrales bacterium]|nr:NUDIX hydrolase [Candidatus Acidoferrales bacterium]